MYTKRSYIRAHARRNTWGVKKKLIGSSEIARSEGDPSQIAGQGARRYLSGIDAPLIALKKSAYNRVLETSMAATAPDAARRIQEARVLDRENRMQMLTKRPQRLIIFSWVPKRGLRSSPLTDPLSSSDKIEGPDRPTHNRQVDPHHDRVAE
ncbi:hypothetical protein C8R44DRAFT_748439 [Mycena epipterygia]|nr:hypothetical protein C8R44DRAFT_748439 [Mycena epipterygia]